MKNYCADLQGGLWLQFDTNKNAWLAKPCCLYKKTYSVQHSIKEDVWQNPEIVQHRINNIKGDDLPIECVECKQTENNGNYSRRQSWNDRLGTDVGYSESLLEIDIQSDFSCNLACSICSPAYSTTWRKYDTKYLIDQTKFKVREKVKDVIELFKTAPIKNLKQIHFQGGEPFLSNSHIDILNEISKIIDPSTVKVWYHSNGTQQVSDRVFDLWNRFQLVEIYFSLDDIGPRMEYQRWPINWQQVHENMMWYQSNIPHNCMINIERTASVLNSYWADELEHWHRDCFDQTCYGDKISVNYHFCQGEYSLHSAVSSEYRDAVLSKYSADHWIYKTFENLKTDQLAGINSMLEKLHRQDQERNLNWQLVYPEFSQWYRRYL
jgi:hypothetical protein